MVRYEKHKLIIEIKDNDPHKLAKDLRRSLINIIQVQFCGSTPDWVDDDLIYANYKVLELLKDLMKKPEKETA